MYSILLPLHSLFRWIVLILLLLAVFSALTGYTQKRVFAAKDNLLRHWTATASHIQLLIGMILYTQSPYVNTFWKAANSNLDQDYFFFAVIHFTCMLSAIALITVGSALAKRKQTDREKFKTMLIWFSLALILIFIAIPWPFSPLSNRPYFKPIHL